MGNRAFRDFGKQSPLSVESQRMTHSLRKKRFRKNRPYLGRYPLAAPAAGRLSSFRTLRTLLVRFGLITGFLILFATLAHAESESAAPASGPVRYSHYFDRKQYPIVTDATFPADDFVLAQARFWWEIYV